MSCESSSRICRTYPLSFHKYSLLSLALKYHHKKMHINNYCLKFKSKIPGSSAGKESACNAGDLGLIPGFRRSTGERNGYPLQYSGLENSMDCYSFLPVRV